MNPRQVEHALYAARVHGDGLTDVYGEIGGQQVKRLVAAYEAEIARAHCPLDLMVAA